MGIWNRSDGVAAMKRGLNRVQKPGGDPVQKRQLAISAALILATIFTTSAFSQYRSHRYLHARTYGYYHGRTYAGGPVFRGQAINNPGFTRPGTQGYCVNDGRAGCTLVPSWFQKGR